MSAGPPSSIAAEGMATLSAKQTSGPVAAEYATITECGSRLMSFTAGCFAIQHLCNALWNRGEKKWLE
jgi:hypothetical protein